MTRAMATRQVTDVQLQRYATFLYDRTGIRISPQKKTLLSNRLRGRMKALGIDDYDAYYDLLTRLKPEDPEWDAFLQEITTHETYLFRDPNQWEWFSKKYLPAIQSEARKGQRPKSLRIWSAACSTGDEVYTIACCIASSLANHSQWRIEILGTDIGIGALEEARKARFGRRAMQHVSESLRRRFFTRIDDETWEAKPVLRSWTKFQQHNLMEPLKVRPFDLIVIKNVLIYFDPDSKRTVFQHLDRVLAEGGHLVTGPAEGMSELLKEYERIHPWLHRKLAE